MCLCYIVEADKQRIQPYHSLLFTSLHHHFRQIFLIADLHTTRVCLHTFTPSPLQLTSNYSFSPTSPPCNSLLLGRTYCDILAGISGYFFLSSQLKSKCKLTRPQTLLHHGLLPVYNRANIRHRHITVNVNNPDVEAPELQLINLDVPPDMTLADLRSSIEAEGIPSPSQNIYHNGQLITDNSKTLQELNISEGDMLALHVRDMRGNTGVAPAHREPPRRQPAALSQDPELIRLQVLGDARLRSELERANPTLAAALENPQRFAQIFRQSADQQEEARRARMREIEALNNDEFNPESQAKIEDMIRQQGVMENLQNAMEYNPECEYCCEQPLFETFHVIIQC